MPGSHPATATWLRHCSWEIYKNSFRSRGYRGGLLFAENHALVEVADGESLDGGGAIVEDEGVD